MWLLWQRTQQLEEVRRRARGEPPSCIQSNRGDLVDGRSQKTNDGGGKAPSRSTRGCALEGTISTGKSSISGACAGSGATRDAWPCLCAIAVDTSTRRHAGQARRARVDRMTAVRLLGRRAPRRTPSATARRGLLGWRFQDGKA
jgi:hypothetical protein